MRSSWWTKLLYVLVVAWVLTSAALTTAFIATNQAGNLRTPTYVFCIGTLAVVGLASIYWIIVRSWCPDHEKKVAIEVRSDPAPGPRDAAAAA